MRAFERLVSLVGLFGVACGATPAEEVGPPAPGPE
jgi:hypothetical protein